MTGLRLLNPPRLFLEIGRDSLALLQGEDGLELALERLAPGRLTDACKQALIPKLREFVGKHRWGTRPRVLCAIGARGVSLRRLALPVSSTEDRSRLLLLQIESEFPLPPDELAWGSCPVVGTRLPPDPSAPKQEFLVVAVRKQVIEEYAELLAGCGMIPVFTLAALARSYAAPQTAGTYAMLDVGRNESEWSVFEDGQPTALRLLPWGVDDLTRSIAEEPGLGGDEAERLTMGLTPAVLEGGEAAIQSATGSALDALVALLNGQRTIRRIYLTGTRIHPEPLAASLARRLEDGIACETLESGPGTGRSVAILGLRKIAGQNGGRLPLILRSKPVSSTASLARPAAWKWVALAVGLVLLSLSLPYVEALLLKPHLGNQLAAIKAEKGRLSTLDRELSFLRYLKQNQPPYLDALFVLAKAVAPGSKLDLVSLSRRGDVSLRGFMKDSQQVLDFRSKLIDSGFFSNVAVEEQTPTPDRQRVLVRINAQWKPVGLREVRPRDLETPDAGKPVTGGKGTQPGLPAVAEVPPATNAPKAAGPKDRRE